MSAISDSPDHYATLGVTPRSTAEEIRIAWRLLARELHPDRNPGCDDTLRRAQAVNEAYAVLSDPTARRRYDRLRDAEKDPRFASFEAAKPRSGKIERNITQDVYLAIEDFIRGTRLEVRVNDPGNPDGTESYSLEVPEETAPRTRFRIPREGAMQGGVVVVRTLPRPGGRFKVRGSDLQTELRISARTAASGGSEAIPAPSGCMLRIEIPAGVRRGEFVIVPRGGLPKPRGGRGDLRVKITYRPEVEIKKTGWSR